MTGFEPAASSSRTKRATKLRHTPVLVSRPKTAGTEGTRYRSSRANSQSLVDHLTEASAAPTTTDPKDPAARQGPLSTTHVLASVQRVTEPALVVRNATLRGRPGTWTIVLDQDAIRAVEACLVPTFFKQWGGPRPDSAGRELDGRT